MIKIENLSFGYYANPHFFSDSIKPGSINFIVGANGSGKTSLLKTMAGLLSPLSGSVIQNCKRLYLQAHPEVSDWLTGEDIFDIFSGHSMWDMEEARDLQLLGVKKILKKPLQQLSMGEQKRIFIAASLRSDADVILFDEPLNSLDWNMELQLQKIFHAHMSRGRSFIVSAHQLQWVSRFNPSLVWFLDSFSRIKCGSAREVLTSPEVQAVFNFKVAFTDNPLDGSSLIATADL
jgi:ABC-type cobalamin/Fe3+-siderophores transport system ATPase subunit